MAWSLWLVCCRANLPHESLWRGPCGWSAVGPRGVSSQQVGSNKVSGVKSMPSGNSPTGIPRNSRGCPKGLGALTGTALVVVSGLLAGCRLSTFGVDPGATNQAQHETHIFQGFVLAGIAVGVIVFFLIMWSIFRYRRRDPEHMPRQFFEHIPLELFYTIVPILIVIVLFIATVITEDKVDAVTPHPAVTVHVLAYQWGWQFDYGNGVVVQSGDVQIGQDSTYPTLVLPVGQTAEITLRSRDVVHGFYVRDFNFSRYAQPGVLNVFDLTVNRPGYFVGQCTQFCGLYHDTMLFKVEGVSPSQFHQWLFQQIANVRSGKPVATDGTGAPITPSQEAE